MYSSELLRHFESPRNAGDLPDAPVRARVENPVCGDILELSALFSGETIQSIRFRAKGCVSSMACGSALCQLVEGRTASEARRLTREQIIAELGGVPQASLHAVQLALDALHQLLKQTL